MFLSLEEQPAYLTRKSSRRAKKLIDLSNYEFKIDLMFQVPEAQEHFLTFLKKSHAEEMFLFCQSVLDFKRSTDTKKQNEKATLIVDQFVKERSPHQINIDESIRESILALVAEKLKKNLKISINIFDDAYLMVYRELGTSFSIYLRSTMFKEWVEAKGEDFIKLIALDLTTIGDRSSYMFKPNDFLSTNVIDRDICFILRLNENSDDWIQLQLKGRNDYNAFVSKADYSIGGLAGLKLGKVIGNIPKSAEEVLALDLDKGIKRFLHDGRDVTCTQEYVKAGDNNSYSYSSVISRYQADIGHVTLKGIRRNFTFVSTVVYDTKRRSYVHVGKTSRAHDEYQKSKVQGDAIFGYTYVKVSPKMCCYVHTFYLDLKLAGKSGDFETMVKSRAEAYHAELVRSCLEPVTRKEGGEERSMLMDTLEDFKSMYLTETTVQKTWDIASPMIDIL